MIAKKMWISATAYILFNLTTIERAVAGKSSSSGANMTSSSYNFIDDIIRIPAAARIIGNGFEFSRADQAKLSHEYTHYFQTTATASGWFLYKLGNNLCDHVFQELIQRGANRMLHYSQDALTIPMLRDHRVHAKLTDNVRAIDEFLGIPSEEVVSTVKACAEKYYPSQEAFFEAAEEGSLLEIDVQNSAFLFGPAKVRVPVGFATIMETMAVSVEYQFNPTPVNSLIVEAEQGGYMMNIHSLKFRDFRWSDISKAPTYYFPILYCLKYRRRLEKATKLEAKKWRENSSPFKRLLNRVNHPSLGKSAEASFIDQIHVLELANPRTAHAMLFLLGYFSSMICVKSYPGEKANSNLGELYANPGKVFLAGLSELDHVCKMFNEPTTLKDGSQSHEILEFYESLLTEVNAIKQVIDPGCTFETLCNRFLDALENDELQKCRTCAIFDNELFSQYNAERARNSREIFEKYWSQSYEGKLGGKRIFDRETYHERLVKAIHGATSRPPIFATNAQAFQESQATVMMLKYLIHKALFTDNLACWQEDYCELPMIVECPMELRSRCCNAFVNRTDTLSSFCENTSYHRIVEQFLGNLVEILPCI